MRQFAIIVFAASAAIAHAQTALTAPPANQVLSAPGGRFVYGQVSESRTDQYLLDTATGRLWKTYCIGYAEDNKQCIKTGVRAVPIVDDEGKALAWAPEVAPKK